MPTRASSADSSPGQAARRSSYRCGPRPAGQTAHNGMASHGRATAAQDGRQVMGCTCCASSRSGRTFRRSTRASSAAITLRGCRRSAASCARASGSGRGPGNRSRPASAGRSEGGEPVGSPHARALVDRGLMLSPSAVPLEHDWQGALEPGERAEPFGVSPEASSARRYPALGHAAGGATTAPRSRGRRRGRGRHGLKVAPGPTGGA